MIPNKETNRVYLSARLQTDRRFEKTYTALHALLEKHGIASSLLYHTKDIWCRDYMPIQVSSDRYVQFRYEPSYLQDSPELRTDPTAVHRQWGIAPILSDINLDGGNIVHWSNKAILTDRVLDENPQYTRARLLNSLEELLQVEIILIPQIKSDMTGHADGMLRFVDAHTLIGTDRQSEYKYWSTAIDRILKDHQLDYVDMPYMAHRIPAYPDHAIGCYVNFLEVKDLLVRPIFETAHNRDQEAYDLMRQLYPERTIETINLNEVGIHGGLLNCVSWQTADGG